MRVRVSTNTYARTILHLINKYSISVKLYLIKGFFFYQFATEYRRISYFDKINKNR